MVNKKFWLGILVMTLVFGLALVGCGDDSSSSSSDSTLNATWVGADATEMKLNNGSVEVSMEGTLAMRGRYSTSAGKLTATITSVHGDVISAMSEGMLELESKWYSEAELKAAIRTSIEEAFGGMGTEEQINAMVDEAMSGMGEFFQARTGSYTVSGDTLTITWDGEEADVETYTRKAA